ncbi:MAG TPA: class I SAM-dependent methyltransferase [Chitinophagaceae bacterium]|nr:class I SAM-dependent methyltransferase [Chitinophagaceae bacterium]
MNKNYYTIKEPGYFSNVRMDIISLLPVDPKQKILEIGAGSGNTLVYIKEKKIAAEVMGVELLHIPGSNQQNAAIDNFQIADIENEHISAPKEFFDVIICADVLEHLADPWTMVDKMAGHLKSKGLMVVSMPNIREIKTIFKILFKGDFKYDPSGGILDKTHLRFFCKKNIRQLLTTDKLLPVYCTPNFMLKIVTDGRKRRIINLLSFGLFENLLTVQYVFIAQKK